MRPSQQRRRSLATSAVGAASEPVGASGGAGGKASDGFTRILDIKPTELHQRVPFYCGSKQLVEKAEQFMTDFSAEEKPKY